VERLVATSVTPASRLVCSGPGLPRSCAPGVSRRVSANAPQQVRELGGITWPDSLQVRGATRRGTPAERSPAVPKGRRCNVPLVRDRSPFLNHRSSSLVRSLNRRVGYFTLPSCAPVNVMRT